MPLPSSGSLKLSEIATEFGGSLPHKLSEYYAATAGIPATPPLKISHFYGKSRGFSANIILASHKVNFNLVSAAMGLGWDGIVPLLFSFVINAGV